MADTKKSSKNPMQSPAFRLAFEQDWLHQEFVTQLEAQMDLQGLNRKQLAEHMGKSPAFVSRAMRQGQNLTIHTMVHMAMAAGVRICLTMPTLAEMSLPKSTPWQSWRVIFCSKPANDQKASKPAVESGIALSPAQEITPQGECSCNSRVAGV